MEWKGIQIERKHTGCYRDGFRFKEQERPVCSENGEPNVVHFQKYKALSYFVKAMKDSSNHLYIRGCAVPKEEIDSDKPMFA
ncbi:hypothetical protein [Paenibacillus dokdonensis]|uniref:hypothetical protein n=1 Tax=Paenibacillus dokdonensis TaxID=2567944 RepID=UPI0010A7846A|nr:hypothetical protein [Paenibacillus dokdonensis]